MSPIIATILLVAITVVLAAVLYVLVSGLTSHGASTPYSISFVSTSNTGSGTTYWDYMGITPTTGLTTSAFGMKVTQPGGTTLPLGAAPATCVLTAAPSSTTCTGVAGDWYGVLMSATSSDPVALYSSAGWTYASGTTTVALNNGYTLIVVTATSVAGSGDVISAFSSGTSSVSGSGSL
ncbi:MAG TPA: type IV pilin N-terminal domain-containing protein [Thermoplasmata archaeon]|nr:type IV pilin N-terminal domain-containing protein [Thermoplasmata archaeon]